MKRTPRARSPRRPRGAALIVLIVVLLAILSGILLALMMDVDPRQAARNQSSNSLAVARDALLGHARSQYCGQSPAPTQLLPCPASNDKGVAQATCVPPASGQLPWLTLGLRPDRDLDARTLGYALDSATQVQLSAGQSDGPQQLAVNLDLAALAAACPAPTPPAPPTPPPTDPTPSDPTPTDPGPTDPTPTDPTPTDPTPTDPPSPDPPSDPPDTQPSYCQTQANTLLSYVSGKDNNCDQGNKKAPLAACVDARDNISTSTCSTACKNAASSFLVTPCLNSLNPPACQAVLQTLATCP